MTWDSLADVTAAVCLVLGSALSLVAAIGLVRFPDLFTRMHAATKPQVLGMLLVLVGIALRLPSWSAVGMIVLVAMFQLLTAPVSAHMIGRASYRTTRVREDLLLVDELRKRIERIDAVEIDAAEADGSPDDARPAG